MAHARRKAHDHAPTKRTAWHVFFAALLLERRSPDFDVLADVPLSFEPQRADLLLVRKHRAGGRPAPGSVLRALWPRLRAHTLVEFKSAARPLRNGDLIRLLGYAAQYHARHVRRIGRGELGLALVVARRSRVLDAELGRLGWRLGQGQGGYLPIEGGPYPGWLVVLDVVRKAQGEEVLGPFAGATVEPESEAWGWWEQRLLGGGVAMAQATKLEGYEEAVYRLLASVPRSKLPGVLARFPAKTRAAWLTADQLAALPAKTVAAGLTAEQLAALPAEKRLAGLTAEKRLAGLSVHERLAGLSPGELAALRAELLGSPPAKAGPKRRRAKATR
jgi:hypothetical protein